MSEEAPARLPKPRDELSDYFRPSLFESGVRSRFHSASRAPSDTHTAVLPVPMTVHLQHLYSSSAFLSQLLKSSGLKQSEVRLQLPTKSDTQTASESSYGVVVLSGLLRRVKRAVLFVIDAVEASVPMPTPVSVPSASKTSAAVTLSAPASSTLHSSRGPCTWDLFGHAGCDRRRCGLPDAAHRPYGEHLLECIDTAARPFTAVPPWRRDFTFVLCRTPTAESEQFLVSLCVPTTNRTRGYIIGRRGAMRFRIGDEAGAPINCRWDEASGTTQQQWMAVTAKGNLPVVDAVVEGLLFLHEARQATPEQLTQHMAQWRVQRASMAVGTAMLSLQSRQLCSPQLDALLASPIAPAAPSPAPDKQATALLTLSPPSIPASPSADRHDGHYADQQHSSSTSYAAKLLRHLRCSSDDWTQLYPYDHSFAAVLSNNSGLPLQPLLLSLPVSRDILLSHCLRRSGEQLRLLSQLLNMHVLLPRLDVERALNRPWCMLRARGDTRQVDSMIEWWTWLMENWAASGYGSDTHFAPQSEQEQTRGLTEHMERWLQDRARYVARHGDGVLYSFISRGLGAQVRLSFPLPAAASAAVGVRKVPASHNSPAETVLAEQHRSEDAALSPSAFSPVSQTSSGSGDSSSSTGSGGSTALNSPSLKPSAYSLQPSFDPPSQPQPDSTPTPVNSGQQHLERMCATGRLLGYPSFVSHPSFSASPQPFIRLLPEQAFGNWCIPAASREVWVCTLDVQAMPLSRFEDVWGVDVFVPAAAENVDRLAWCNVCVKLRTKERDEQSKLDSDTAEQAAERTSERMDAAMLAVMRRAQRVEQLVSGC